MVTADDRPNGCFPVPFGGSEGLKFGQVVQALLVGALDPGDPSSGRRVVDQVEHRLEERVRSA
jgi:hypothetical protein